MPLTTASRRMARCGALALLALVGSAWADTGNVTPGGFVSIFRHEVKASPEEVWRAITQLPRWWSDEHTYSGQAARMSLDPQAGGCWCERWGDGNSVEHARVLHALPPRSLRLRSALGPLQELP
ncbi:MAG TPA: SRPBCC domain-containing protein, partial [Burkholderiaceae bacterium]|nr:SRPBCC domain-containing protein [Burkholderiaceae bacterium]